MQTLQCIVLKTELSNNEENTVIDDNEVNIKEEVSNKLTPKTEFRANRQVKVVWKQYRLLNPIKKEKELKNLLRVSY